MSKPNIDYYKKNYQLNLKIINATMEEDLTSRANIAKERTLLLQDSFVKKRK